MQRSASFRLHGGLWLSGARPIALALAAFVVLCATPVPAHAELPAVARPRYDAGQGLASATVFFLATEAGPVSVGAGHSFDLVRLAASAEIIFERGRARDRAASATRVLAGPGIAFSAPGGSLRTDLVVFALDAPPRGVRVLEPGEPRKGMRVRILGIPAAEPIDEQAIAGRIDAADEDALEVEVEGFHDLRGWGGAPIVADEDGRVVGFLQGAQLDGRDLRVIATPIAAVVDALRAPHERGRGRSLASLGGEREVAPA